MECNKTKKPKRIVTFGNFEWIHWITVGFFFIGGLASIIIPSIFFHKITIAPIVAGSIIFLIGVMCICDHIIFKYRMKKWHKIKEKNSECKGDT